MSTDIDKEQIRKTPWETLTVEATVDELKVHTDGLNRKEASERLTIFGENKLPEAEKDSFLKRFLMQFNNALIFVLIGAAVLTALLNHWLDTWVIIGVVFINAIVGYIQEDKAQKALDSIKNLLSLKALVMRDGRRYEIAVEKLVPGDIVLLKSGDKVPADIRLINVNRFEVDESSLTGESVAVSKTTSPVATGTVLGERESMTYAGTTVRTGSAVGVVTGTAIDTEVGKINTMLSETKATTTPLMRKINGLGKSLSLLILVFSLLLVLFAVFIKNDSLSDTILSVIGLAVAAIPEGLPAILTITLAIGVQRMARKNAIVRRLPSVETLGSVTVICSDKTGTLTKNEMTATDIYTTLGDYKISGLGYAPEGEILYQGAKADCENHRILKILIQASDLCNDADIIEEKGMWTALGAPTEAALKTLVRKANCSQLGAKQIDEIPFDSKYKYRATLHSINNRKIIFANGAPEKLINVCGQQITTNGIEPIDNVFWESKMESAAARGQRLIGCAYKDVSDDKDNLEHSDLNNEMTFIGIVGIIDPPRPEAIESIRICRNAGIRVKMITGDHVLTARAIGTQMGITDRNNVISGAELEEMDDEQIKTVAQENDLFARTSPEHKLRLVKALQEVDEIVAMTGDGVNDAPALKKADIGVAMGIKGTEVTKDSAEMVLADDNFSSIVSAVEEGRTIYDNIRKTLLFILPTNGAEALVIIASIVFGFILPITPVQILWVNMVTAVTLALSLAFEPAEQHTMQRPPRGTKEPLIGGYFLFRILYVSVVITIFVVYLFSSFNNAGYEVEYSRTMAVNMLVFGELFYLFNCRKLYATIFSTGFWNNRLAFIVSGVLLVIQLGFTYLPFMQVLFGAAPLRFVDWLYLIAGGIILLLVVELEKLLTGVITKSK